MLGSRSTFARRLLKWYDAHRRELPWRLPKGAKGAGTLNPYHVLVSEAMLQQTQVATVIPYFHRFLEKFPTVETLAAADEQAVLRMWQGLGYYSRARNLQAATRQIVLEHGGTIPADFDALLALPGVGRYTAGAVGSIAFDLKVPILDGNVERVLCRADAIVANPREPAARERLWSRAEEILPSKCVGDFNSALMELGATVCLPRSPHCLICPVRAHCEARAKGLQNSIPAPRPAKITPRLERATFCIRQGERWLIEQRPNKGRWAGMWQFITLDAAGLDPTPAGINGHLPLAMKSISLLGSVEHSLTHRRYRFQAYLCESEKRGTLEINSHRKWVTLQELDEFPLSRPQLKIAAMLLRQRAIQK